MGEERKTGRGRQETKHKKKGQRRKEYVCWKVTAVCFPPKRNIIFFFRSSDPRTRVRGDCFRRSKKGDELATLAAGFFCPFRKAFLIPHLFFPERETLFRPFSPFLTLLLLFVAAWLCTKNVARIRFACRRRRADNGGRRRRRRRPAAACQSNFSLFFTGIAARAPPGQKNRGQGGGGGKGQILRFFLHGSPLAVYKGKGERHSEFFPLF